MSTTSNNATQNYVIIGAGPVGLLTALALRKYAPDETTTKIDIYERRPNLEHTIRC